MITYDPTRFVEIKPANSSTAQVYPMQYTGVNGLAAGNNQQVIAGVSGKRLRVFHWTGEAAGTQDGSYNLKNGSGGTIFRVRTYVPALPALPEIIPFNYGGYFETDAGVGLFTDIVLVVSVATAVTINVCYVAYTP